jgi:hypothetical protein
MGKGNFCVAVKTDVTMLGGKTGLVTTVTRPEKEESLEIVKSWNDNCYRRKI